MIDPQEIAKLLSQGSFNGITFDVLSSERSGRNHTTDEPILGQGTRTRMIVGDKDTWSVSAILIRKDGPWADAESLITEFRLAHDYTRTGEYVDPYDGVVSVIPTDWSFTRNAREMDHVRFRVSFSRAELETFTLFPGVVASSPDDVVELLTIAGGDFADEPEVLRQLLAIQASAQGSTNAETSSRITEQLANGSVTATSGTPAMISEAGAASRAASLGEYSREAYASLRGRMLTEAARSNSQTLLQMREILGLYLSGLGADAFGRSVEFVQGRLSAVPSARSIDELARLNRDAVNHWSFRDVAKV